MSQTRLLFAEDNADHRRLIVLGLTRACPNIDVSLATSRDEVVASVKRQRFDCFVLDYHLPPHSAPEILQTVKPLLRDTPVVVISSLDEQAVVIESLRTGVADFVPKEQAVLGEALWSRIQSAIAQARALKAERRKANRRIDSLRKAAEEDSLTGLLNRRFASRFLASARTKRDRRGPVSCVMIDLDHFKSINDQHGHAIGDVALRAVAGILQKNIGVADQAIRWGGEEFFAILSSCPPARAWSWAEELRRAIQSLVIEAPDGTLQVTASMGIATVPVGVFSAETAKRADLALYLAKELGRNRVCTAEMADIHGIARELTAVYKLSWAERADHLLCRRETLGRTQIEHTGVHCRLVRDWAIQLGRALGFTGIQLNLLQYAAKLHDVGKLAVPEDLLSKSGPLTDDEKFFVDEHARFGGAICHALNLPIEIESTVAAHHDRFDARMTSSGPIPWAHLVAVADAYVTMTSYRPYAMPQSVEQALAELRRQSGDQFNPVVVDAMERAVRDSTRDAAAA